MLNKLCRQRCSQIVLQNSQTLRGISAAQFNEVVCDIENYSNFLKECSSGYITERFSKDKLALCLGLDMSFYRDVLYGKMHHYKTNEQGQEMFHVESQKKGQDILELFESKWKIQEKAQDLRVDY